MFALVLGLLATVARRVPLVGAAVFVISLTPLLSVRRDPCRCCSALASAPPFSPSVLVGNVATPPLSAFQLVVGAVTFVMRRLMRQGTA